MKILAIDDDSAILEYISIAFEIGWPGACLISAHQGREGLDAIEKESPDMVLLDLSLPDISGYEILKKIRSFSSVPIIVITVKDCEQDVVKGLSFGADDYLIKPFGQMELLARVRNIIRRINGLAPGGNLVCGQLNLDTSKGELYFNQKQIPLTNTECIIMQEFMKNPGTVLGYEDLADSLWGGPYPSSKDTLRVYIRRLRKKLEEIMPARVIHSKSGTGYMLEII